MEIFDTANQQILGLQETLASITKLVQERQEGLRSLERQFDLAGTSPESFASFVRKPYLLRHLREDQYELIIPRFIGLSAGWPVRAEGEYNVYRVSRFIDLINPLPPWLRDELGFETQKFTAHLDGDWLVVDSGDVGEVWQKLGGGKRFSGRDGSRIRIIARQRFQTLRDLVRQGVLPYTPQPIPRNLLRPASGKIILRPKQERDFQTFLQYGAVSVFATGSAGKTFFGMYAADTLKGRKAILAPRRSILDQWEARMRVHCPQALNETELRTYQSLLKRPLAGDYTLIIYDEIQSLPANTGMRAAQTNTRTRIGLSATPWREDGNEDLIPALCGIPVGADWDGGEPAETTVWLVSNEDDKFDLTERLTLPPTPGKTMIFVYRLDVGARLSKRLGCPFIHGNTNRQYEAIQDADTFVISKVGDAGISVNASRVIEVDWLGGRAEAGQRALRTRHADQKGELHLLMTKGEYRKHVHRLTALAALNFDVKVMGA